MRIGQAELHRHQKMGNQQLFAKELKSFRRMQEVVLATASEIKRLANEHPDKAPVIEELLNDLIKFVDSVVPKEISWKL